jgi:uncharacterized protein
MKYLLVLLVLAVAYGLWRNKTRRPPPAAVRPATAPQAMVECAHCGLHLPRSEALAQGAQHYCCSAHRSAGPR